MEPRSSSISTTGFVDGLGRRSIRFDRELGTTLECLQVRPELRAYEEALLSQACAVSDLADTRFMRVRSIDQEHGRLMVISELAPGDRLSDIVDSRFPGQNPVSTIDAAFGFFMQMLSAVGRLHQASVVHGALAPGHVILGPNGRLILTDTIFGTSLPRLNLSRRRLWQELQVAFPADARDNGADLAQSAMCAMIVALGRPIDVSADPLKAWPALIDEAAGIARARGGEQLAAAVKDLFRLLLPVSGSPSRVTLAEANERVLAIANDHLGEDACAAALLEFVRYDAQPGAASMATAAVAVPASPIVPESAPLLEAVLAGAAVVADVAPAAVEARSVTSEAVTIEENPATEFVPSRTMLGIEADGESSEQGAIPSFLDRVRKLVQTTPFTWKVGAAAVAALVILMTVGIVAGPSLFKGEEPPAATTAAAPAPARRPKPAPPAAASSPTKGAVSIQSQPEGATVLLDGMDAGHTPLMIDNLTPGRHSITLSTETASVKRNVRIEAGKTLSLDVPVAAGWVAITTPIVLDVSENGRTLGTTAQGRINLSPGRHTLRLSNRDVTYSSVHTVEIAPGQESAVDVKPTGRVNLNAQPWAEVWIDGARAGETPIANLQVPLGTREFVFKHPQYGERRITAKVSTVPSALSVDFTKSAQRP